MRTGVTFSHSVYGYQRLACALIRARNGDLGSVCQKGLPTPIINALLVFHFSKAVFARAEST